MSTGLKILVVDDNIDNADSLAELFELEGHSVRVCYNGEDAIAAYENEHFDLAFMDVMMPGKNGIESFLEIRQMCPNARVYMMTGYSVDQLLQQAVDNGALGIFSKPVDLNKVLAEIAPIKPNSIVLVAEDDPDFGPALRDAIRCSGFSCELVATGKQALSRVTEGNVEILILDLNLPLIDGLEVFSQLRSLGYSTPTVMISGCMSQYKEALAAFGDITVTGILTKPFDFDDLLKKLPRLAA